MSISRFTYKLYSYVYSDLILKLLSLLHMPDELGESMREVRTKYGFRLTGGYDLVVPTMIEEPSFYLKTLYLGVTEDYDEDKAEAKVRQLADEWKSALPEDKHKEFEEILDVGRRFFRIRDERGLQTDLSGIGLCRRGLLEAGRRLVDQGVILEADHLWKVRFVLFYHLDDLSASFDLSLSLFDCPCKPHVLTEVCLSLFIFINRYNAHLPVLPQRPRPCL